MKDNIKEQAKEIRIPKTLLEAVEIIQSSGSSKFDESIDLDVPLKINTKKNENIRGSIELSHGIKRKMKIAVIADMNTVQEVQAIGIELAGCEDLIEKIVRDETLEADVCLCTIDMFPKITKLAKILGPLKLMPNKKDQTVTNHIKQSIESLTSGKKKNIRNDSAGHIRLSVGKKSFQAQQILENIKCCMDFIKANKPEKTKELFKPNFFISSTQGISVKCPIGLK